MWGAACAKLQPPELRRESSSGSRPTGVASSVGLNTRAAPDKPRGGSGRAQAAGTAQHQAPPRRGVGGAAGGGGAVRPSGVAHGKSGSSLHGQRISIEAAHGVVPAVEYAPAEGAKLVGCVLLTPGSGGGLGPGVAIHPQPFDDIRKPAAVGAIYTRLGMELSTGRQVTWAYQPTGEAIPELAGGNKSADPTKPRYTIAVVQIDWTRIPRTKLRRPDMLESAIADGLAGADYLANKFPNVPLILGGFSFGGPTVWAVARRLQAERPGLVGGLVAMAGSARGGELYEQMGVDTAASVRAVSAAGVPVQFVHGTHDKNVALQVAEFLYKEATAPKEMVVLPLSAHMMDTHREAACGAVRRWVLSVLLGAQVAADGEAGPPVAARVLHVGKRPALRPGELKGREKWRIAPSKKRLERYCNEDHSGQMHPLAGFVGYSE